MFRLSCFVFFFTTHSCERIASGESDFFPNVSVEPILRTDLFTNRTPVVGLHWLFCYFQKDSVLSVSQASHQLIFIKERLLTPIITQSSINRLKDGEGHPPGDLEKSRIKPWGERTHRKGRRNRKLLCATGLFLFWFMCVCVSLFVTAALICAGVCVRCERMKAVWVTGTQLRHGRKKLISLLQLEPRRLGSLALTAHTH